MEYRMTRETVPTTLNRVFPTRGLKLKKLKNNRSSVNFNGNSRRRRMWEKILIRIHLYVDGIVGIWV